jgi:hypothetical protein
MSNRRGLRKYSTSYGSLWYGGNDFPGFLYKRNLGVSGKRSTLFSPGGNIVTNNQSEIKNNYIPGSGVGATNIASRRAKLIHSTFCYNGQKCGDFITKLG